MTRQHSWEPDEKEEIMCELEHRDNLWAGKIDHKISERSEVAAVEKVQAVSKADNWH
jgi:acyl-CoA hydrolase